MIGSPVVLSPDILVAMNKASLDKYLPLLGKKGLLLFDSSLTRLNGARNGILSIGIPATKIASSLGNTKSANVVMLGALVGATGILRKSSIIALLDKPSKSSAKEFNMGSFLEGMRYIENKKS
jgi:2-oxoglutarate ferredoxin oxidoreductase subunit gamma